MNRTIWLPFLLLMALSLGACHTRNVAGNSSVLPAPPVQLTRTPDRAANFAHSGTATYPNVSDYVEVSADSSASTPTSVSVPPSTTTSVAATSSASAPTLDTTRAEMGLRHHTVLRGDTLYSISQRYGSSAQAIREANGLSSDLIYPGDSLRIP
ncbi:MAG: LysM peptidoglycan-binding domain-containing protein [Verrucomicrobiota bacterium]